MTDHERPTDHDPIPDPAATVAAIHEQCIDAVIRECGAPALARAYEVNEYIAGLSDDEVAEIADDYDPIADKPIPNVLGMQAMIDKDSEPLDQLLEAQRFIQHQFGHQDGFRLHSFNLLQLRLEHQPAVVPQGYQRIITTLAADFTDGVPVVYKHIERQYADRQRPRESEFPDMDASDQETYEAAIRRLARIRRRIDEGRLEFPPLS